MRILVLGGDGYLGSSTTMHLSAVLGTGTTQRATSSKMPKTIALAHA